MHPLRPHHVPPSYAAEMADYETDILVSFQHLYEEDYRLRRRYGIPPRLKRESLRCEINRKKIRRQITPGGCILWDLEHFFDTFCATYQDHGHTCARRCRASVARCYMEATPAILADPNWLPRMAAAKAAGIRPDRLITWTESMKILPYWDTAHRRLLFPVDQLCELATWRPMHFLLKHCTPEQITHIRHHAPRKNMYPLGMFAGYLYRVPELAHL